MLVPTACTHRVLHDLPCAHAGAVLSVKVRRPRWLNLRQSTLPINECHSKLCRPV